MSHNYRRRVGELSNENVKLAAEFRDGGKRCGKRMLFPKKNSYVMEHLATFSVNKDAGIVQPLDGMRRLLQMEKNTGIWSQKMKLRLESNCILITDYETGDLIETFAASLVQSPTAFTSEDLLELYNNVLVFIVSEESGDQSEMHIFQSQCISAVNLVQDIRAIQGNEVLLPQISSTMSPRSHSSELFAHIDGEFQIQRSKANPPQHCAENPTNKFGVHMGYEDNLALGVHFHDFSDNEFGDAEGPKYFEDTYSVSSEKYEREVNLLNNCFDDIEKFIARLQHTAAAVREVERRRQKKRDIGDGLINLHTRPPMQKDFLDILSKFKLSFNLLSKLKTHIHDPNAPELVHFLFTPLALIVEAARDTYADSELATKVIDPLLTRETINFLINCVSSKETELWKSLGVSWTTAEDQWREKRNSTFSDLFDGVLQDNIIKNSLERALSATRSEEFASEIDSKRQIAYVKDISPDYKCFNFNKDCPEPEISVAAGDKLELGVPLREAVEVDTGYVAGIKTNKVGFEGLDDKGVRSFIINTGDKTTLSLKNCAANKPDFWLRKKNTFAEQWVNELRIQGAQTVVVCYPRTANNDKELSVMKGEYLEILDDTRKWWKARNIRGHVAHVPSTIVAPVNYSRPNSNDLDAYDEKNIC